MLGGVQNLGRTTTYLQGKRRNVRQLRELVMSSRSSTGARSRGRTSRGSKSRGKGKGRSDSKRSVVLVRTQSRHVDGLGAATASTSSAVGRNRADRGTSLASGGGAGAGVGAGAASSARSRLTRGSGAAAFARNRSARQSWRVAARVVQASNNFKAAGQNRHLRLTEQREKRRRILAENRMPVAGLRQQGNTGCCAFLNGAFDSPTVITPNVLLGDRADSKDASYLLRSGVTHILNATSKLKNHHESRFIYLKLPIADDPSQNIRPYFEEAIAFIDDAVRHGTRVMVHCVAGVSRSATLVLAWMMSRQKKRLAEAIRFTHKKRPIIHPNESFLLALAHYEVEVFGTSSVAGSTNPMWNYYKFNAIKGKLPRYHGSTREDGCCSIQ